MKWLEFNRSLHFVLKGFNFIKFRVNKQKSQTNSDKVDAANVRAVTASITPLSASTNVQTWSPKLFVSAVPGFTYASPQALEFVLHPLKDVLYAVSQLKVAPTWNVTSF